MENLSVTISSKFHGLLSYLTRTKETFEMVADEIEDCNLKTAFLTFCNARPCDQKKVGCVDNFVVIHVLL